MKNYTNIQAVIFDMDGVIIDSEKYWKQRADIYYKTLVPNWTDEDQKDVLGLSVKNNHNRFVDKYGVNVSWDDFSDSMDAIALYICRNEANLITGIEDLFESIRLKQKPMALASASRVIWIEAVMERFQLANNFKEIVSSDDVQGKGKPHPAIYNYTAAKLGIENQNCVVIEDSMNGVLAAKAAGMQCIGFRNGVNQNQDLSKADVIVDSFDEVVGML